MKKFLSLFFILSIFGCAQTNTGPMSAGKDTYVLSRQAGAFPTGKEPLLAEALTEANAKCDLEKKKLMNNINTLLKKYAVDFIRKE